MKNRNNKKRQTKLLSSSFSGEGAAVLGHDHEGNVLIWKCPFESLQTYSLKHFLFSPFHLKHNIGILFPAGQGNLLLPILLYHSVLIVLQRLGYVFSSPMSAYQASGKRKKWVNQNLIEVWM